MLKHSILAGIAIASFTAPSLADVKNNPIYITVGAGNSFVSDIEGDTTISGTKYDLSSDMENSFFWQLGVGKHINKWRLEAAFSKFEPKMENITATTGGVGVTASIDPKPEYDIKSYMFNVYRDFTSEGKKISPYIGAGLGSTSVKMKNYTTTVSGTDVTVTDDGRDLFTWSIKGGANYRMNDSSDLFAELSYSALEKFSEDDINYDAFSSINLIGGLRYKF